MFALYRKGFSHVVDGIQCEIVRVELNQIDEYKANGWTDNIRDLNPEKQAEEQRQAEEARLKAEAEAKAAEEERLAEEQRQAEEAKNAPAADDGANGSDETSDEKPEEQPEAAADVAPKKRGRPAKAKTEGAAE